MFVVGLSGGIGSGKSTVSDIFARLGVTVVDTDVIAREVVEPGTEGLDKIREHFGDDVITDDGSLDRKALRKIVFEDASEKIWLENLLHPIIRNATRAALGAATSDYALLASPLLLESPDAQRVDRVAIVDVPESVQISRAASRDNADHAQIKAIMASQMSRHDRLAKADDVIDNSGDHEKTRQQVYSLHTKYLQLAKTHQTH